MAVASRIWQRRVRRLLLLVGLCALATIPIGWRECRAERDAREADELLSYLIRRARAAHAATGSLPRTAVGPTPALGACCELGGTCAADVSRWQAPAWRELGFTIDGEHRYSYSYAPRGTGAVITEVGDTDCDGIPAIVEAELAIAGDGTIGVTWKRERPLE
jgi:hypothetical protein